MRSVVYFIECKATASIKIGVTSNIGRRVASLKTGNSSQLVVLTVIEGDRSLEARLHARFRDERVSGEWFRNDGELSDFVATITGVAPELRPGIVEAMLAAVPARYDEDDLSLMYLINEIAQDACVAVLREKGAAYCADRLSRYCPRPVLPSSVQGVIDGKYNLRIDWLFWLSSQSEAVRDSVALVVSFANRDRADAEGEVARLHLALLEQEGFDAARDVLRKARSR